MAHTWSTDIDVSMIKSNDIYHQWMASMMGENIVIWGVCEMHLNEIIAHFWLNKFFKN